MFSGVKDNLVFCIGDESKERFYNLKIVKFWNALKIIKIIKKN
jgi:hypothetical protein